MSRTTISAVVPTFNRAALLTRALRSVFDQRTAPLEIIVVDDGSTDDTRAVVESFADDRVKYVYQSNSGVSAARNRGARVARGAWVAFLDSDDTWYPDHIDRMRSIIDRTGGIADMYFSDSTRSDQTDRTQWQLSGFVIGAEYEIAEDARDWLLMDRQPMMIQSAVFNRQTYQTAGGCWEQLRRRNDTHLFFRIGLGRRICAVRGVGVDVRTDDGSSTRLTVRFTPSHLVYHLSSIDLYGDVLSQRSQLTRAQAGIVRSRIASSHLALARNGEVPALARGVHGLQAVVAHPRTALRRGARFVRGRLPTSRPATGDSESLPGTRA